MRYLQSRFSIIFVVREGKSSNSCFEIKEVLRPLPYISNTHLVCIIASLPRSGLAQAIPLHPCLDNRCRTLGISMRQFRRKQRDRLAESAHLWMATLELQIGKRAHADARQKNLVLVI
jgi:hypothetical protein